MTYTAIPGKGESSYGACVPDLPGCVAVGGCKSATCCDGALNGLRFMAGSPMVAMLRTGSEGNFW